MFDKLKQAFSGVTSAIREKQLTDEQLDQIVFNFQLSLIESDVAQSVAEALTQEVEKSLSGTKVDRSADLSEVVGERLSTVLGAAFANAGTINLLDNVREKKKTG